MSKVDLVEDTVKNVTNHIENVRPDDAQTYYLCAYLPVMAYCLASIADSLEKIADKDDLSSCVPIQPIYKKEDKEC